MTDAEKIKEIVTLLEEAIALIEKDPNSFHFEIYMRIKNWVAKNKS